MKKDKTRTWSNKTVFWSSTTVSSSKENQLPKIFTQTKTESNWPTNPKLWKNQPSERSSKQSKDNFDKVTGLTKTNKLRNSKSVLRCSRIAKIKRKNLRISFLRWSMKLSKSEGKALCQSRIPVKTRIFSVPIPTIIMIGVKDCLKSVFNKPNSRVLLCK